MARRILKIKTLKTGIASNLPIEGIAIVVNEGTAEEVILDCPPVMAASAGADLSVRACKMLAEAAQPEPPPMKPKLRIVH